MATATISPPVNIHASPGVVFHGVTWADYEAMLRIVGNRPIRVTYDQGEMELMSPLWRHGSEPFLMGSMILILSEELGIPFEAADPVTLRRADLDRGAEPDKLFYFRENGAKIRGKRSIDLTIDPPPDLVIEADLTSSSIPKLPIFAALGIPEVWRLDEDELQFLHLQVDGSYLPSDHSLAFPMLPRADVARLLEEAEVMDKMAWVRRFRAYVRANFLPADPA